MPNRHVPDGSRFDASRPSQGLRAATDASSRLDGQGERRADATLGHNDARCDRISLELPPQPKHLDVDAAIKDALMDAGCLKQILARERPLGRIEKRDQQGIFAFRQRHRLSGGGGQTAEAPLQLPATHDTRAEILRIVNQAASSSASGKLSKGEPALAIQG